VAKREIIGDQVSCQRKQRMTAPGVALAAPSVLAGLALPRGQNPALSGKTRAQARAAHLHRFGVPRRSRIAAKAGGLILNPSFPGILCVRTVGWRWRRTVPA